MKNNQNGITLVALVVTIIILLLLAGITISSLTGSGLFEKTQQAEQKSEDAQILENTTLSEYENWLGNYIGGGSTNIPQQPEQPQEPEKTTLEYAEGAKPSGATITKTDVTKGIVMVDTAGNEWTWVEVPKTTVFKTAQNATDYTNIKTDLINYATTYRKGSATQSLSWTDEYYDGCGVVAEGDKTAAQVYTEMYNKMLSSVYTNGGFWISTYEIGDSTATKNNETRTSSSGTKDSNQVLRTPVSKADQIPYNYVKCSQAQTLASGMSTDTNKTSSLLFGIQWDLVCKYLEVNGDWETTDTITATYYLNENSTSWGNYKNKGLTLNRGKYNPSSNVSGTWTSYTTDTPNYIANKQTSDNTSYYQLLTTGASEQTNKLNIYDFAGNEYEWTLEHATSDTSNHFAIRGGNFVLEGSSDPASHRLFRSTDYSSHGIGFRATLY